ncbi:hypothetical protein DIPPA_09593 [Diplonema papillatum]|nr:hypothetical protein DIPPA_09593 [Diplonema papillatum]
MPYIADGAQPSCRCTTGEAACFAGAGRPYASLQEATAQAEAAASSVAADIARATNGPVRRCAGGGSGHVHGLPRQGNGAPSALWQGPGAIIGLPQGSQQDYSSSPSTHYGAPFSSVDSRQPRLSEGPRRVMLPYGPRDPHAQEQVRMSIIPEPNMTAFVHIPRPEPKARRTEAALRAVEAAYAAAGQLAAELPSAPPPVAYARTAAQPWPQARGGYHPSSGSDGVPVVIAPSQVISPAARMQ